MTALLSFSLVLFAFCIQCTVSLVIYPEALQSAPTQVKPQSTLDPIDDTPLPVVIWHGLGDNFEGPGLKEIASLINEAHDGTYVHIIQLADTAASDKSATFLGNVTEQIELVCQQLADDPILSTAPAIDAIGFSQGGQFMRGYVERCNWPPVRNLLTFGSQHNGISKFQSCDSPTDWVCHAANALLRSGTWSHFVQSRLVPAQYFRDPEDLDSYLAHSNFLADINNERGSKNPLYKENLSSLNKFVMYLFKDDKTVVPKESSWFAEVNGTSMETMELRDRPIYKEDWIGLKALDEKGGLVFEEVDGGHMQLNEKDLIENFKKYFGPQLSPAGSARQTIDELAPCLEI